MLPVSYRLSLAISFVLLLSVLVTAALNFLKFNQVMEGLEDSRYGFVTRDIKSTFEQNLNLGLPIDQIENARAILDRQMVLDPAITRIEVFDADGAVLYTTARLEPSWTAGQLAAAGRSGSAAPENYTSRPIINDFGQVVAGVVVYRSTALAQTRDQAILETLMLAVVGATAAGILITILGASHLLRGVRRHLLDAARALRVALQGAKSASFTPTPLTIAAAQAMAEIDAVEAEVDRHMAAEASP